MKISSVFAAFCGFGAAVLAVAAAEKPAVAFEPDREFPIGGVPARSKPDASLKIYATPADAAKDGWRLVWGDEFNAADPRPDPTKWTYEKGFPVRNKEAQFYTADRRENARVENGKLILEARKENYEKASFTSASVTTERKFALRYGRVEIRAKLPRGRGLWPAFWMLEIPASPPDPWQRCGEIDIMEHVGHEPKNIHTNLHAWNDNSRSHRFSYGNYIMGRNPFDDFHLYWMEWTPDKIEIFYDNMKIISRQRDPNRPERWPFDKPFYFLANLAIGGSWGGVRGIDEAAFPARLEIDYVRMYQKENLAQNEAPEITSVDPLEKVYQEQKTVPEIAAPAEVAKGETVSFQWVVRSKTPIKNLRIEAGDLQGLGAKIKAARVAFVGQLQSINKDAKKTYPDPLLEIETLDVAADANQALWASYNIPRSATAGYYGAEFVISGEINGKAFSVKKRATVKVHNVTLPEQTLWVTNWVWPQFLDKMNNGKPVKQYSARYWELLKKVVNLAREHGQNLYLTYPLETSKITLEGEKYSFDFIDFDKRVEFLIKEGGLKRIEGGPLGGKSHGKTAVLVPDGKGKIKATPFEDPVAQRFLSQFVPALWQHLKDKGWDKMYLQHVSDEPTDISSYNAVAHYIKSQAPGIKTVEATILAEKIKGNLDVQVPIMWAYKQHEAFYKEHQAAGGEVWFYTSCDDRNHANRFLSRHLLQTRAMHWFNFRYGITGYLHWGLNWWEKIGGASPLYTEKLSSFPAGDSWIIYPADGRAFSSLRFAAMRDGIADYELLKLLAKKDPVKAAKLAAAIIPASNKYVKTVAEFRKARRQLLLALAE